MSKKTHWVIPDGDSVTVKQSKKSIYPVKLICHGHELIEEIEIPKANYIKIKVYGKWAKIYLPSEITFELDDSLKFSDSG